MVIFLPQRGPGGMFFGTKETIMIVTVLLGLLAWVWSYEAGKVRTKLPRGAVVEYSVTEDEIVLVYENGVVVRHQYDKKD